MGMEFPCWQECLPDVIISHNHSTTLSSTFNEVGKELPLVILAEIAYGNGAGHPYFGVHRRAFFPDEERHTYLYHATPGRVLKDQQASDYFRLDHLRSKPMLYCLWILTNELTDEIAKEVHHRWECHRFNEDHTHTFDCAVFVTDLVRYTAQLAAPDTNNPFSPLTPSNTITQGKSEDRGVRSVLRHAFHPPSLLVLCLGEDVYSSVAIRNGLDGDNVDGLFTKDDEVFNITSQ